MNGMDGWWVIHGPQLLALLVRAHAGEDPELLYVEAYANSDVETHEGDGSDGCC